MKLGIIIAVILIGIEESFARVKNPKLDIRSL